MTTLLRLTTCLFLSLTFVCTDSARAQVPAGFGALPTFHDEFNGTQYNALLWILRGAGTVRDACHIDPSAVSVSNGFARIRIYSKYDAHGNPTNYCGALSSEKTFLQAYGYWEAAIRFKYRPGMQSSFWLQSPKIHSISNQPAQSGVEMDIFEHISGATSARAYDHALHWNGYDPGISKSLALNGISKNLNDGKFHRFGLAWTPQALTFYVDGVVTWSLPENDAVISAIAEFIILDTEIQNAMYVPRGGYGRFGSTKNAYLDIDYIRVYPYLLTH